MIKRIFTFFTTILICNLLFCQYNVVETTDYPWAQTQLKQMTLEEKIAQLCILRIHSNFDEVYNQQIIEEIATYQPGGVCFFQGGPARELALTNRIQAVSNIPLLVSIDGEWGPAMRLDSTLAFPRAMTLGALDSQYDSLIFQMGQEIARQCLHLGIHLNYAPVVDVNNNKNNPVINFRSFGEDKNKVVRKSWLYLSGMQSLGVWGCIKHFPGHGDTDVDSHLALPIIHKSKEQLHELELYPYKQLFSKDINMVMVSPLNVPALDANPNSIALISKPIITDLLQKELGYKGLVITDGMEMEGLRKHFPKDGEAEIRALLAGNDLLLLPDKLSIVIPAIKKAIEEGRLSEKEIDKKCLRVLIMKEKLKIHQYTPLSNHSLSQNLNSFQAQHLTKQIEKKALTLLKGEALLPLKTSQKNCLIFIGDPQKEEEYAQIATQFELPYYFISKNIDRKKFPDIFHKLANYDNLIVALTHTRLYPKNNYGVTSNSIDLIKQLANKKNLFLSIFGNPYILENFAQVSQLAGIVVAYQENFNTITSTIDALYGRLPFEGKLPVSSGDFTAGTGITTKKETTPQKVIALLPEKIVHEIDSIVYTGISQNIYPGCQVLAMKGNQIIFDKNYGYTDYSKQQLVTDATLYDLASITKTLATTLAMMKLYEDEKYELHDPISKYLPDLKNSNKQNITILELLTHTSGLPAFVPFYKDFTSDSIRYLYLNDIYSAPFTIEVAKNLYLNPLFQQEIDKKLKEMPLRTKKYVYSDLGFYYLYKMVEKITGRTLDEYVETEIFNPMGLNHTCYNPLQRGFSINEIAPTEKDETFREQVVHGYVHDQLAALCGGVCGNAGLFSTADEVAKILTMLMQNGVYDGKRIFKENTVKKFTKTHSLHGCNRRALGFYTPSFDKKSEIIPTSADKTTYGHQGFTGTVFWCDPENQISFIFLSNRVHPKTDPNLLSKSKIRLILHEKIYQGLNHDTEE